MAERTPANRPSDRKGTAPAGTAGTPAPAGASRTAMIWVFTIAALLLLVLLIIFILQNQDAVQVRYFGLAGSLPLGVALLIAAVAGGLLVAVAGVARVTQLRLKARRDAKRLNGTQPGTAVEPPVAGRRGLDQRTDESPADKGRPARPTPSQQDPAPERKPDV
ncbi:hypothetical protein D477_007851 [Arthrobacter crystallopoietes BAB-32]|uniref:Lipopolysaccharide assembly protein A domain-containing protein n=1 Tax=Arthrobacter crystallopoietes BAB-32 TaxID=1246476 RepID=N1V497_9MICC|nr:LapA family protein [Arthrobacter crystallopoietes]EMY34814.1 hypothetical protein D477_007851 [Arthrobacter crystallopoietes BAB-32]